VVPHFGRPGGVLPRIADQRIVEGHESASERPNPLSRPAGPSG
jgi:hypothetical protein